MTGAAPGPPPEETGEIAAVAAHQEEIHEGNQFVKILRHGSWYFVASIFSKLAGLVLVPIYTRYLPPSQYGILGSLDAVSRLLPLFLSLYLDSSFIRFYYQDRRISKERVRRLYSTQFWFVAVWGLAIVAIGLALAPLTIQPLVDVPFAPFMPLVFAAPLFTQLGIMGSQVMRADLKARQVSLITMASFGATGAVSLTLLIGFGYGVISLLWGLAAGPFVSFIVFTIIGARTGVLGWTFDWGTLRRSLLFSIPLIPNVAGGWINGFSNRLILAHYGTLSDVGLFTISAQLGLVMYFIIDAVTQVQDPIGMSALTDDPEAGKRQIAEFVSVFMWPVLGVFLAITLFSKEILIVLTAPAYHDAYTLVGVFALAYVGGAIYRVFTVVLMFRRRLWVIASGAVVSAALNVVLMFALIPSLGRPAAAITFLVSTLLYTAWIVWWSQRSDRVPLNWRLLGPTILSAAVVLSAYVALELLDVEELVALPAKVALMAIYAGLIFVVPGMQPLRAGVVNQLGALRDRLRGVAESMRIYGEEHDDDEVRRFVTGYKRRIEADPHGRYVAIREIVPSGGRVLDYGCGWGGFSKMLEERGSTVVGIDLDDNQIDICKHVWGDSEQLSFQRAEITELADESFDCVVSNEVIEHVHNPGTYLDQINRVLTPGGTLVISLPNGMTPRLMLPSLSPRLGGFLRQISAQARDDYRKGEHHINSWDAPHFVRLVSTVGFRLEQFRPMEGIALPHGRFWPSYVRFRPLRNLSYSMAFAFKKVERSRIGAYD